ncbi:MAG: TlyA family RNA methyltransferase [Bifidobacterium aquikefiri]|uniref:Cell division protein FtsJ n=2 Tax=Bifidobacterium aquikefiri TaxID=1653207 RepID=A0A261G1V3_9BIFI|nr:TlyA family RNA methyltransferase [Bifidobacterium aquikefiri]OZG65419.1 cell division protein FtsJ [Bifidobacterium aquikefiri]
MKFHTDRSSMSVPPKRLDRALVEADLIQSRTKAQQAIAARQVRVNGQIAVKSSTLILPDDHISVDLGENYVSRGALKLAGAFEVFLPLGMPDVAGLDCLDIGASTGGFTDVALRRGARRVIALDVGHGQLDERIASDPRVFEMDGVNIRDAAAEDLPFQPQCVVSDVSFISLTYVIPAIALLLQQAATCILLIKPQFEVGRTRLGHHGIVESEALRQEALQKVINCARDQGFVVRASAPSPIEGTHGNREYLLWMDFHKN